MICKYAQLDPRPTAEARAHNETIFTAHSHIHEDLVCDWCGRVANKAFVCDRALGGRVWGLEVTNKEWAARCEAVIGNQHGEGKAPNLADYGLLDDRQFLDSSKAACEVALTIPLPPAGTTLLFDRVDLDAVCAAAILELRASGEYELLTQDQNAQYEFDMRVQQVSEADNFAVGKTPWQPYPLPTAENPWPSSGSVDSRQELAAINRAIMDRSVPLETRVGWVKTWLLTGAEPCLLHPDFRLYAETKYRAIVEREQQEIVAALALGERAREAGTVLCGDMIDVYAQGGISIVQMPGKSYPGATGLGFALAPVTVCVAEHFQPGDYRKITIASWGVLSPEQMGAIRDRLNKLEPIWTIDHQRAEGERRPFAEWQAVVNRLFFEQPAAGKQGQPVKIQFAPNTPTWGGNLQSGILGSPQGRSTEVSVEQVLDAVTMTR